MTRDQLAHVLRAAARIAEDPDILVIGSQSILGSFSESELPADAWISIEADLAFLRDPGAAKADAVDGAIGELSTFHETFAYYAQGVEVATATLPEGWRDRVVPFQPRAADPARAQCLDPYDLVLSKLVAMRPKDLAFAHALVSAGLIDRNALADRLSLLHDVAPVVRERIAAWVESQVGDDELPARPRRGGTGPSDQVPTRPVL